jgi:hypothetical protein
MSTTGLGWRDRKRLRVFARSLDDAARQFEQHAESDSDTPKAMFYKGVRSAVTDWWQNGRCTRIYDGEMDVGRGYLSGWETIVLAAAAIHQTHQVPTVMLPPFEAYVPPA